MNTKCMICYNAQVSTVNTLDSESVLDNYPVIFLLRKLLPVSSKVCEDLLKESGHPSSWFSFCGSCLILVLKSQILYSQLVHIQNDFENLQEEINRKIRWSFENGQVRTAENTMDFRPHGSTEKIRDLIAQSWGISKNIHQDVIVNDIKVEVEVVSEDNYESTISDEEYDNDNINSRRSKSNVKREMDEDWVEEEEPQEKKDKRRYRQPKRVKCPQCDQRIVKDYMEFHIKKVHEGIDVPKPFSCSFSSCDKSFKRLSDMQIHFRRKHSKETPYPCPYCNKKFTDLTKKHYHIKNFHIRGIERKRKKIVDVLVDTTDYNNDEQTFTKKITLVDVEPKDIPPEIEEKWKNNICHLCNKPYTQVQQHIRRVHAGLRPYKCETCLKDFVSRSDMERHIRRKHTKETPFSCNDCDKKFTDTTKLFYHYRKIHPETKNPYRKRQSPKKPLCKNIANNETITSDILETSLVNISTAEVESVQTTAINQSIDESLNVDPPVVRKEESVTVTS